MKAIGATVEGWAGICPQEMIAVAPVLRVVGGNTPLLVAQLAGIIGKPLHDATRTLVFYSTCSFILGFVRCS